MASFNYTQQQSDYGMYPQKSSVHFNSTTTVVSDEKFEHPPISLQIIALPIEYSSEENVADLVQNILVLGEPENIRIIDKKNYNQSLKTNIVTRTALIDFKTWFNTDVSRELYDVLQTMKDKYETRISVTAYINSVKLHWDNGDTMTHLSLREARPGSGLVVDKKTFVSNEKLTLTEEDWTSLYIPILPNSMYLLHPDQSVNAFQPKYLQAFIENELNLGKVSRVDFIDRELENGTTAKAVFIHFEYWNDNANAKHIRDKLNTDGQFRQRGYYDGKYMHKFLTRNDNGDKVPGYFVFKINHKPIPEVSIDLNMAQLVAANKVLTEKMVERDEEINNLKEQLRIMQEKYEHNE